MSELEVFTFPATGQGIRTVLINDVPHFVATDVCAVLGYRNGRDAVASLPERMRNTVAIPDGNRGNPNRSVISEPGVYRLVMRSTLPAAEAFQDWLAEEVVPSIRRAGGYGQVPALPSHPEALRGWAAEIEARQLAEARAAELAPSAEAWDTLASTDGDLSVADAAKILARDGVKTGQKRLFAQMGDLGWLYRDRRDGDWRAYQTHVERGLLAERVRSHLHPLTGERVMSAPQIRVTADGLAALRRALTAGTDIGEAA